jgi:hypothetical protein
MKIYRFNHKWVLPESFVCFLDVLFTGEAQAGML